MIRSLSLPALAGALLIASNAVAATFSFASDSNPNQWTFASNGDQGGFFTVFSPLTTPIDLVIDDHNGPLADLTVQANLVVNLTATLAAATPFPPNLVARDYFVNGTIQFVNPLNAGDIWLTIAVGTAATPPGNPSLKQNGGTTNEWGTGGFIAGSGATGGVTYTASQTFQNLVNLLASGQGATAADYSLLAGTVSAGTSFGFTLTAINSGDSTSPGIGPNVTVTNNLPARWRSEGSFSGAARIPAPSAAAIVGAGALLAARRRRN